MQLSKKKIKNVLKYVLSIATIVMMVVVLYNNQDIFKRLWEIKPSYLALLLAVNLFHGIAQAVNFRALIYGQGLALNQLESFELTMAGRFYNFIFPLKAGNVLRSVYLKKIHEFPYKNFLFFMFYQFISFLIVIPIFMAVIFWFITDLSWQTQALYSSLSLALSICAYFISKGPQFFKRFLRIKKASMVIDKMPKVSAHHWRHMTVGVLLFWFANALKMYVAFKAIDLDFSLLKCLAASGGVLIITQIGITPGDMGSKEFIISFSAKLLNLPIAQGLLGALIDRAAEIFITIPLGIIYGTKIVREQSIDLSKHMKESQ